MNIEPLDPDGEASYTLPTLARVPLNVAAQFVPNTTNFLSSDDLTNPIALTVAPAPLTITAGAASKTYGAVMPNLGLTYAGFVDGDSAASLTTLPKLATNGTARSDVGTSRHYGSGAFDPDYTITYVAGLLSVTSASLTITASDTSKVYGAALPSLTASYYGFVNGDTPESPTTLPTLATIATATSQVGSYPLGSARSIPTTRSLTSPGR